MIDYDKIKRKRPQAFDLFLKNNPEIRFEDNAFWDYHNNIIFPCYCDFEQFFDEQKIIILYLIWQDYKGAFKFYKIDIIDKDDLTYLNAIKTKTFEIKEAKEQAIYKAFEILEKKLNEVKK
jgi:hypothetical protein